MIPTLVRCVRLALGSWGWLMVVEDAGQCCGEETRNFKISCGVRVHVAHIVSHHSDISLPYS